MDNAIGKAVEIIETGNQKNIEWLTKTYPEDNADFWKAVIKKLNLKKFDSGKLTEMIHYVDNHYLFDAIIETGNKSYC